MRGKKAARAMTDIEHLMARVGFLLLHWGRVEYEVQAPPPATKVSAQIAVRRWARAHAEASRRDGKHRVRVRKLMLELGKARKLRNLVAHGMVAAFAATENFPEPTLKCLNFDGDAILIGAAEIDAAIAALQWMHPELQALNRAAGIHV